MIIFEGIMAFADKELLKVRKGLGLVPGKPGKPEHSSSLFCSLNHSTAQAKRPRCPGAPVHCWTGPCPPTVLQHQPYEPALHPMARWWEMVGACFLLRFSSREMNFSSRLHQLLQHCAGEIGLDSCSGEEQPLAEVKHFSRDLDLSHSFPGTRSQGVTWSLAVVVCEHG